MITLLSLEETSRVGSSWGLRTFPNSAPYLPWVYQMPFLLYGVKDARDTFSFDLDPLLLELEAACFEEGGLEKNSSVSTWCARVKAHVELFYSNRILHGFVMMASWVEESIPPGIKTLCWVNVQDSG